MQEFHFWRLVRNAESEFWAIGHPASNLKEQWQCDRVGEVWVAFDSSQRALHLHTYLEPALQWNEAVPIVLSTGVVIEDTYLDVLFRALDRFFEVGFDFDNRFYEFAFVTGSG